MTAGVPSLSHGGSPWDNSSLPQGGKSVTDKSAIIVKPSTAQAFETLWKRGRVLFFSAPCGFGKTVLADTLLDGRPVLRLNAADTGFALPSLEDAWDILLIDNIQDMQEERDWQALCALIREGTDRRFVLLSRGIPPACLMAFQYAGMRPFSARRTCCLTARTSVGCCKPAAQRRRTPRLARF